MKQNEGGYISWYDLTKEIYRQAGYTTKVVPVSTEEYGLSKAKRPFNSRLDKRKLIEAGFKLKNRRRFKGIIKVYHTSWKCQGHIVFLVKYIKWYCIGNCAMMCGKYCLYCVNTRI